MVATSGIFTLCTALRDTALRALVGEPGLPLGVRDRWKACAFRLRLRSRSCGCSGPELSEPLLPRAGVERIKVRVMLALFYSKFMSSDSLFLPEMRFCQDSAPHPDWEFTALPQAHSWLNVWRRVTKSDF